MTGRGLGNCPGAGRGRGWGLGLGGRCCWCPFASGKTPTKEEQKKLLQEEKEVIEQELAELDK
jgi:hypothetical protein